MTRNFQVEPSYVQTPTPGTAALLCESTGLAAGVGAQVDVVIDSFLIGRSEGREMAVDSRRKCVDRRTSQGRCVLAGGKPVGRLQECAVVPGFNALNGAARNGNAARLAGKEAGQLRKD